MHLKSLKIFCDVVDRRSFSRAADENGISQSGASQVVHQLEKHLDVKLIDRSKRPLVLTPEGETFYRGSQQIVHRYHRLEDEVRTLHEEVAGRVVVASIYSIGLHHMNRYLQEFLARHPKANVRLEYLHPENVYAAVEDDAADLGLVSYPRAPRGLEMIAWREEAMTLVCHPEHELARRRSIQLHDLHGRTMVAFETGLSVRREIDRVLAQAGVEVDVAMEFDNIETIKRAVEIDAGVSLLPEPTVVREVAAGSLAQVPLAGVPLARPLGIIYRRGKPLSGTVQRFLDALLEESPGRQPGSKHHVHALSGSAWAGSRNGAATGNFPGRRETGTLTDASGGTPKA